MHHRRKLVLTLGALLLSAPLLSSCGFNYGTDRINTTTNAVTNRDKDVDVVGAVLIAQAPGSATLSAQMVNNSRTESVELRTVTSSDPEVVLTTSTVEPFEIAAARGSSVADAGGVRIEGDFMAGSFLPLQLGFSNGDEVVVRVPVVRACGPYTDLDDAPAVTAEGAPAEAEEGAAAPADAYTCDEPMYDSE